MLFRTYNRPSTSDGGVQVVRAGPTGRRRNGEFRWHIAGRPAPVVGQGVQHLIHEPIHLDRWPANHDGTRIVMVVRGLDPALIQRSFEVFVRLGSDGTAAVPPQPALSSA